MCVQSFVALHCVLRKSYGFLDPLENWLQQEEEQQSGFLGPVFRVQQMWTGRQGTERALTAALTTTDKWQYDTKFKRNKKVVKHKNISA